MTAMALCPIEMASREEDGADLFAALEERS